MSRALLVVILTAAVLSTCATFAAAAPAAPSSIAAVPSPGTNGTAMDITVGASPDDTAGGTVVSYRVYRKLQSGGPDGLIKTITASALPSYSFTDNSAALDELYTYSAEAFDGADASTRVTVSVQSVDADPPKTPRIVAKDKPNDQGGVVEITITASPDDGSAADDVIRYDVERRLPGQSWAFWMSVTADNSAQYKIEDTGRQNNKLHRYGVKAWDGKHFSNTVRNPVIPKDNLAPAPARNAMLFDIDDDNGQSLMLRFDRSLDDGTGSDDVKDYRVARQEAGVPFRELLRIQATGQDTYEYTNHQHTPGVRYVYRIWASDGPNQSGFISANKTPVDDRNPARPNNLVVADHPNDEGGVLDLTWEPARDDGGGADDVIEYRIYRQPIRLGGFTLIDKIPATKAANYAYTDSGLTNGQPYRYRVKSYDGRNTSKPAVAASKPIDNIAPGAPSNVVVADVPNDDGGSVTVAFDKSAQDSTAAGANDVINYNVRRKKSGSPWEFVRDVPATDSSTYNFTDTDLTSGKTYTYNVRAFDGSNYSAAATGTGKAIDDTPPAPPTQFAVVVAPNARGAADITFLASADDTASHPEVTRYDIFRRRGTNAWGTKASIKVTARGAISYTVRNTNLRVGSQYTYKARAVADTGVSDFTADASITADDTRKPLAPRNLAAGDRPDDGGQAVIVNWDRSLDDGTGVDIVNSYFIYRKLTSVFDTPTVKAGTVSATGAASYEFTDDDATLTNLRSYTYWAVAVTAANVESDPSNLDNAVPQNNILLKAPTNLIARDKTGDSGGVIELQWTRSTSEGSIGTPPPPPFSVGGTDAAAASGSYEIFRRQSGTSWSADPYDTVSDGVMGDPIFYFDTGATTGVTFEYKVRYRVGTAISPFSNTASAESAAGDVSSSAAGLTVAITETPDEVSVGVPVSIVVDVSGEGLSGAVVQRKGPSGEWSRTAQVTKSGAYTATFSIVPGGVEPGDNITVVAVAADADTEVTSDEIVIEITE